MFDGTPPREDMPPSKNDAPMGQQWQLHALLLALGTAMGLAAILCPEAFADPSLSIW